MFVGLFSKKKDEMPTGNIRKLVQAVEDSIRAMKLTSVKQSVEGAIALALLHGKELDWEKVGSSHACPLVEMAEFFKKAKEYAPKIASLILPAPTPSITTPGTSAPSSSTPAPRVSVPSAPVDRAAATEVA
jgi:hypothetical protein